MTIRGRYAVIITVVGGVLAVDQLSKWLMLAILQPPRVISVLPFFNLRLGFNTGISFGMLSETLANSPEILIGLKLMVIVLLLSWAFRSREFTEQFALAMIAGGALGNVVDRWRQGAVTDFVDLHLNGWHWPTFNLADVAISAGAALLVLSTFLPLSRNRTNSHQ